MGGSKVAGDDKSGQDEAARQAAAAARRMALNAKQFRYARGMLISLRRAVERERRWGSRTGVSRSPDKALQHAEEHMSRMLAQYPEFADPAVLRRWAPTRWERLLDRFPRRTSH